MGNEKNIEENRCVVCGDVKIDYVLTRKKVKNVNLRIKSDGSVLVSANNRVSVKRIEDFIISRADFITTHQKQFKKLLDKVNLSRKYVDGEEFLVLGEIFTLSLIESATEFVDEHENKLRVYVKNTNDTVKIRNLITKYYDDLCSEYFNELSMRIYPIFKEMNTEYPTLKMRNMKSRWGSCIPSKTQITLNKKLIHTPKPCIEYVVLHEYCHFIHPNHSKEFYALVERIMPDYKIRRKLLHEFGGVLRDFD